MGMLDKAKGMVQAVKPGVISDRGSAGAEAERVNAAKMVEEKASGLEAWPTGMRFAFALAASALIIFLLSLIAGVFMPTFLAFSLALAVRPASEWLIRHRWPVGLAALVNIVLLFAILFVMLGLTSTRRSSVRKTSES